MEELLEIDSEHAEEPDFERFENLLEEVMNETVTFEPIIEKSTFVSFTEVETEDAEAPQGGPPSTESPKKTCISLKEVLNDDEVGEDSEKCSSCGGYHKS